MRQQQGDAAQRGWNRRNQRHDVDMHEVMEHVDIRIGSRDIRATVFATIHTPHDSTHPRGVRNKELVELGPEGDPAPTLPLLDRNRRAHGGRDSGGKQIVGVCGRRGEGRRWTEVSRGLLGGDPEVDVELPRQLQRPCLLGRVRVFPLVDDLVVGSGVERQGLLSGLY